MLIPLLIVPIPYGCGDVTGAKSAAYNAIDRFHQKFNAKQFSGIYRQSHRELKKSGSIQSFNLLLQTVYSKLGKVKSTENQSWTTNKRNNEVLLVLHQKTVFKKGIGMETFRYIVSDKKAILAGYKISSNKL